VIKGAASHLEAGRTSRAESTEVWLLPHDPSSVWHRDHHSQAAGIDNLGPKSLGTIVVVTNPRPEQQAMQGSRDPG